MKSRTQILIAFFSAMAVTLVAVSDLRRTSPGGLASVHQRESELAGRNDCSACHGGLFGSMRKACLECHEPIAAQLEGLHGLHGQLGARSEQCGLCHAEHHGSTAPLVHGQSFALAGVPRVSAFDHQLVGFVLDGAHAALECSACHVNAEVALLPRGETRYLGLERDCQSCHEDPHAGEFAALACASCHGQESWTGLSSLGHERFLALVGGHAELACAQCHAEGEAHSFQVLGAAGERGAARDCAACHASPHAPLFAAGAALLSGREPGAGCVDCHAPEHTDFHDPGLLGMSAEQHAASGFPLEAPHAALECTACHAPTKNRFRARYPGRTAEQCSACHADVHAGQFETGPFAAQECTACHASTHFTPHTFDREEHAQAALELSGRHLSIECQECHAEVSADGVRAFRGTPEQCDACHADAHDGFFAAFLRGAPPPHGECARCHDTTLFAGAAAGFEHAAFTGFALQGAHAESECAACHAASPAPDASGRTFGRVHALFGAFEGCQTCHADPHGGHFDVALGFPAEVENRADCARCHQESSFRALPRPFEHGYWTGFTLSGAHAEAKCAACHAPLAGASRTGRTSAEASGAGCADCHEDPHGAQFANEFGASDCQRCHDSEPADFLSFDHERDARFALGEAHRALDCAACHPRELRAGLSLVRYRPLGSDCRDCHGSNAEVLLRRQPRR